MAWSSADDRSLEASRTYTDPRTPEQKRYAALSGDINALLTRMARYTSDPKWAGKGETVTLISAMDTELSRKLQALRLDAPTASKLEGK